MEVNWQTLPDSTRENQRLQGGVFITYIELASTSLGGTCMENISWTQASVSGWEFLDGGGGGGRFSAPLWQIFFFFFLSAQILALHFSQFVTLASTYFGNYSHSFIFISQPSFVPNGWVSSYWKICLVSVNVCLLLGQISFAKSVNIISSG